MVKDLKNLDRSKLNARFHQLVNNRNLDKDEKQYLCHQVTNGQFTSSKDLSNEQLVEAIKLLNYDVEQSIKKMRAKAINKAKELSIVPGEIAKSEDWKGLNSFCHKTFKKPFFSLSYDDLRHCITALENWQINRQDKAIKELMS